MIVRRVMTGLVAVVVALFSLSMLGVMWKLNVSSSGLDQANIGDHCIWSGKRYTAELFMKEGVFDRFVFYCSESA